MKEGLASILFLLSLMAFALLILGFFKPSAGLFWYKGARTKKASALLNGVIFFVTLVASVSLMPEVKDKPAEGAAAAASDPASTDKPAAASPSGDATASSAAAAASSVDIAPTFGVVKVYNGSGFDECEVIMLDRYRPETLIEKARQLKEQDSKSSIFRCHFYYKKVIDDLLADATVEYNDECRGCTEKDKDGTIVAFSCRWRKSQADSLLALHFDTAGFKQEAVYLDNGEQTKNILFSSNTSKALLVSLSQDDHDAKPLVKKTVDGETRYYDESMKVDFYYVINHTSGAVEQYLDGAPHWKDLIENDH